MTWRKLFILLMTVFLAVFVAPQQELTLARYSKCLPALAEASPVKRQVLEAMSPELHQKKLVYSDPGFMCNQLYSIYEANSDGSGQTVFTSELSSALSPSWSPDGTKLVVNQYFSDIYILNADGTNPIKVTSVGLSGMLYSPKWSRDGQQIAFTANKGNPLIKTFIVNVDGTHLVELPNSSELNAYVVSWSPDSSQIVYTEKSAQGNYELYLMDRDGSNPSKLADGYQADWSPDGKLIAFATNKWVGTQLHSAITVIRPDGLGMKELFIANSGQYVFAPVWSPKGHYIAFGVAQTTSVAGKSDLDIYVIDADGSNPISVNAHAPDVTRKVQNTADPTWSFDEQFIAYGLSKDDGFTGTHDIGLTEVSSGKSIVLIEDALSPAWQP